MNNEVAIHNSSDAAVVDKKGLLAAIKRYEKKRLEIRPIFLTFSGKTGKYNASDGYNPPEVECLVSPEYFFEGHILWGGGYVREQTRKFLLDEGSLPDMEDLPKTEPGNVWRYQMGFISAPIDNPIYRYAFSTSSASGVREVQKLLRIISEKLESGEDHHPIINFKSEPFMSRGMKNLKPVFDIKEWSAADVHQ